MNDGPNIAAIPVRLPVVVDLMKLAASIEARGGNRKVSGALRNAWRAQSCLADLKQAQSASDAFAAFAGQSEHLDPATLFQTQSALISMAVILYARATSTGGGKGERGSIQLDAGKLTAEQQQDHEMLVRLRNGAIGHVETGARIAGDVWHRDFLFAKSTGAGNWGVASASLSVGFQVEVAEALRRQVPVAMALVSTRSRERLDKAIAALREQGLNDRKLLKHQVDPVEWFGSIEAALLALSGGEGEETSAWLPLR